MTETNDTPAKPKPHWAYEFGPLLVFFIAFQIIRRSNPDDAMLQAAGIFAITAIIALLLSWLKHKTVSPLLIFATVIIGATAGLAIWTDNKLIFFIKPTIMNVLYGLGVIGGVIFKRNIIQLLLGNAFEMPEEKWNVIAIWWGLFFFACAIINEVVWRNFSENFWVTFKTFGFMPLTFLFMICQIPFIQKYGRLKTDN
jgi:intracellular septation protein